MVLDPATLDLVPRAAELLACVAGDARFKHELPAAQVEIVTPPLDSVGELAAFLAEARRDLARAAGCAAVRLAAAGVHPFAATEGELSDDERYRPTLDRFGRVARRSGSPRRSGTTCGSPAPASTRSRRPRAS